MHRDAPEMAGKMWGKDTAHAGSHGDTMPCVGVTGLHAMSQQGLKDITNSYIILFT